MTIHPGYSGNNIFYNSVRLSAGTIIASLIPILLQPVLRNLYSPEAFGAFSVYISVIGIIVVISSLKYELAITLPEHPDDAKALVHLAMFFAVLLNIILLIVILMIPEKIISMLNFPEEFRQWIYFIPVSALLFSIYNTFHYWMIRNKLFLFAGLSKVFRRTGEGAVQISLSAVRISGFGLFAGDLTGQVVNAISGLFFSTRKGIALNKIDKSKMLQMAKRYRQFAVYNTIPTLLNTLTIALPVFLVNIKYGETNTGYLDLARLLLFIPIVFISEPLSQVLLQRFNEFKINHKSILSDFVKLLFILIITGIIGILMTELFSDSFVNLLFGDIWKTSAYFSTILVISVCFRFITEPFKLIFAAFEKIKIYSIWQIFYFIIIFSLFFVSGLSIGSFLWLFVVLESVCFLVLLGLIIIQVINYERVLRQSA